MENLKLWLKYGANVSIKNKCGHTARDKVQKHPECEKILQEQEGKIQSPERFAVYFYRNKIFGEAQWPHDYISVLVSRSNSSGSSPGRGYCVVLSPPRCINGYWKT